MYTVHESAQNALVDEAVRCHHVRCSSEELREHTPGQNVVNTGMRFLHPSSASLLRASLKKMAVQHSSIQTSIDSLTFQTERPLSRTSSLRSTTGTQRSSTPPFQDLSSISQASLSTDLCRPRDVNATIDNAIIVGFVMSAVDLPPCLPWC